ncbi:MAG: sensor histidine kinase [Clostridia bacterium]|nr:sensor histidine kinase [Clostridia bacterium]
MKELSLNILDIAENSLKAGATQVEILLTEKGNTLTIEINDNGCGMSEKTLENVINPFYTTRTTRKVGLGIPFFKEAAEKTGGSFEITSVESQVDKENCGTKVKTLFYTDSIDFTPIGDIISTITTLIHGSPDVDFVFKHKKNGGEVSLDTREIKAVLGDDIPLNSIEVIEFIRTSLKAEYNSL